MTFPHGFRMLTFSSVVFSYWTTSLDMVERAVKAADIGYVRFDGGVSAKNRELSLRGLKQDPRVRVILITVSFLNHSGTRQLKIKHWPEYTVWDRSGRSLRSGSS